jgi:hypothetical protein
MQLAFRFYTHTQRIGLEKLRDSARDTIFSDRLFFLLLLSVSFAIQIAQELWHWARGNVYQKGKEAQQISEGRDV